MQTSLRNNCLFTWAFALFLLPTLASAQKIGTSDLETILGLNVAERVEIMSQLKAALTEQYSGFAVKSLRMQIDLHSHLDNCVKEELEITDDSRIHFMERIQRCLSAFDDGHLRAGRVSNSATVALPIRTDLIDGKVRIVAVEPKFVQYYGRNKMSEEQLKQLTVGGQVLEIDDKSVAEWMSDLGQQVHSSSELGRKTLAAQLLTRRNFMFSETDFARVKVKTANGDKIVFPLPWLMLPGSVTPESTAALRRLGIPNLNAADGTTNSEGGQNAAFFAYPYFEEFYFVPNNTFSLVDASGNVQARFGEIIVSKLDVFCYLDLRTASDVQVKLGGTSESAPLLNWVKSMVQGCEQKSLPLVVDLRHNSGGSWDFPEKFFSLLVKSNGPYPQPYLSVRTTKSNLSTILTLINDANIPLPPGMGEKSLEAAQKGEPFSPPLVGKQIQVDPDIGGFHQPIVALTGPLCASGCEVIAGLLKKSGRAKLLGQPTMGTGLGYFNSSTPIHIFFDRFNIFSVQIPIVTFGILPATTDASQLTYKEALEYSMENRPVEPDVYYEYSERDLMTGGKSMIGKLSQVITQSIDLPPEILEPGPVVPYTPSLGPKD